MLLALDVGNTHIVVGFMEGMEIKYTSRISTNRLATEMEYAITLETLMKIAEIDDTLIDAAIISSVVPQINNTLERAVKMATGLDAMVVGSGIKTGVNILLDDPAEAGSDLVVAAAGALHFYEPPLILIDMGTATTVTVVDKNGAFRGGAIIPGMGLSLNALTANTSLLPSVSFEAPDRVICTNTVDCMKSGCVYGTVYMLDGMIDHMEAELGEKATVIATGGLSKKIVPLCSHEIVESEDLLLYGLAVIYAKNQKKK